MANRDKPQQYVLIALVFLAVLMVLGVFVERGKARRELTAPMPRVSLHAAPRRDGPDLDSAFLLSRPLDLARVAMAPRFDFPLGSENGALSYNAQPFRENGHLGDDFNGIGGWDSDRGDPVYAVAGGRVMFAGWPSDGWGHYVILAHRLGDGRRVQSIYAHLERVAVAVDDEVSRGQEIGTVGKGAGQYLAHLHFEVRENDALHPGSGYSEGPLDRLAPSGFLEEQRGGGPDFLNREPGLLGRHREPESGSSLELRLRGAGE